jgi:hypothetical protein
VAAVLVAAVLGVFTAGAVGAGAVGVGAAGVAAAGVAAAGVAAAGVGAAGVDAAVDAVPDVLVVALVTVAAVAVLVPADVDVLAPAVLLVAAGLATELLVSAVPVWVEALAVVAADVVSVGSDDTANSDSECARVADGTTGCAVASLSDAVVSVAGDVVSGAVAAGGAVAGAAAGVGSAAGTPAVSLTTGTFANGSVAFFCVAARATCVCVSVMTGTR